MAPNFLGRQIAHSDYLDTSDTKYTFAMIPDTVQELGSANLVSSVSFEDSNKHKPALDIDIPMHVFPSSTKGCNHLYFDVDMTWDQYVKLLDVMEEVGILQAGFVKASKKRGATYLRLPWVKKKV